MTLTASPPPDEFNVRRATKGERSMFGLKKKGPTRPCAHADNCKILKADPNVELHWSEIRRGAWEARCVCSTQYHYEEAADPRVRLDPLDPSTGRHFGQCEHRDTTDPALLRVLLKFGTSRSSAETTGT